MARLATLVHNVALQGSIMEPNMPENGFKTG
jgi:hypothetical protein